MINADLTILSKDVLRACETLNIEIRVLNNSKANCIAFTAKNRKRREFEITFLKNSFFRISTRFIGYKSVFERLGYDVMSDNDPDGRRKRFNIHLSEKDEINILIIEMLKDGFSANPVVELI